MPADITTTTRTRRRQAAAAAPTLAARPPELAQLVWRRALALVDAGALHDPVDVALDLLRAARHQPAVMAHASTLGRTHLRIHAGDDRARAAARLLQAAIAFLGVKPLAGDVASTRGHRQGPRTP